MLDSTACWKMGDRCLRSVAVKVQREDRAHPLGDYVSLVFSVLGNSIGIEVGPSNLTFLFMLFITPGAFSVVVMKYFSNSFRRKATYNK